MQPQYIPEYQMTLHRAHKARAARQAYQVTRLRSHKAANTPIVKNTRAEFLKSWKNMVIRASKVQFLNANQLSRLLTEVEEKHGIDRKLMKSKKRKKPIVLASQEFYYKAKRMGFSLPGMSKVLGKDHTTALHGVRNYTRLMRIKRGEKHLVQSLDKMVNWDLIL